MIESHVQKYDLVKIGFLHGNVSPRISLEKQSSGICLYRSLCICIHTILPIVYSD